MLTCYYLYCILFFLDLFDFWLVAIKNWLYLKAPTILHGWQKESNNWEVLNSCLIVAKYHVFATSICDGIRVSNSINAHKNKKLRIEKIGKIGNFVLKNRRKIVLLSTKIDSLHPIRVITKATSPQLLDSQDLYQLSLVRRSENDW